MVSMCPAGYHRAVLEGRIILLKQKCPNEKPTFLQIHTVKWTILTPYHRTGVNTRAIHTKTAEAA